MTLGRKFIQLFKDHDQNEWQQQIINTWIFGTFVTLVLVTMGLGTTLLVYKSYYAACAFPHFGAATLLSGVLYALNRQKSVHFGGVCLIGLYLLLAFSLIDRMAVEPAAVLLCSAAILLTGILYGFWYAVLPTALSTAFLVGFRVAEVQNMVRPDYMMYQKPTPLSIVVMVALLLHVMAIVSGSLYRYLEQARLRLQAAQDKFEEQKNLLRGELRRQSKQLETAESEKIRQFYKFAELGEMSTALLHDLANNLSSLTLEIDDIETRESGKAIRRAKDKIKQINNVLGHTRKQIQGQHSAELLDLIREITKTVKSLQTAAKKARVTLEWTKPAGQFKYSGDKILFQQLLTNLITNALDSYAPTRLQSNTNRKVLITLKAKNAAIFLTITDYGKGIKPEDQAKIFEPFYTTKKGGMGMGLYLTKRFIEDSFGGSIELKSSGRRTMFTITLPKNNAKTRKT